LNTGVVNAGSKGSLTTETGYRIGTPTFASDAYEVSFSSSYEYRATDSDGDYLEDGFTITFQPEPSNAVEPVAIDLNSNGVSYIPLEQSIVFNDSYLEASYQIAWVSDQDGILAIDTDSSASINSLSEFVFTQWSDSAATDLEAIQQVFDTNNDFKLDANDDQWLQFGIWQDLNFNGVSEEGEFQTLDSLGVNHLKLTYEDSSETYTAADGDVTVHGQTEIVYSDGSSATAEDASFAIQALTDNSTDSQNPIGSIAGNENIYSISDLVDQFVENHPISDDVIADAHSEILQSEIEGEIAQNTIDVASEIEEAMSIDEANIADQLEDPVFNEVSDADYLAASPMDNPQEYTYSEV